MSGIYFRQQSGLDELYRGHLVSSILASEYFGPSVLGDEFVGTSGLSLVFQRDHLATVGSNFPFLNPLLEKAMFDTSNAFYVNPLILDENSTVKEHVDCRYIVGSGARILPTIVSVYYAEVDERMEGGDLVFATDDGEVRVRPQVSEILHFIGTARHFVSKITGPVRRVSVVIEQYNLRGDSLAAFPECHLVRE